MKKLMKNTLVDAFLLIVLGIVLLIKPSGTLEIIFRIIGVTLLVMGAVRIISFFTRKDEAERSVPALIVGIAQAVIGLLLIAKPDLLISVWYMVAAALIGYGAIVSLIRAVKQMNAKVPGAVATLVLSIATLVLAIVVFINPAAFAAFYMQLIGISFIVEGAALVLASIKKAD